MSNTITQNIAEIKTLGFTGGFNNLLGQGIDQNIYAVNFKTTYI